MNFAKKLFLLMFVSLCMPCAALAQTHIFNEKQTMAISCAMEKLFAIYDYLDAAKPADKKVFTPDACGKSAKPIPPPARIQELLTTEMEQRMLWEVPGTSQTKREFLSEAEMWRRAFAVIYEFLSLVEKVNDGTSFTSQEVMEQFGNIRTRLLIETDRLNTNPVLIGYNMRDSMDGRGRALLATLELINKEMDSVGETFPYISMPRIWRPKFRKPVMGIVVLSNTLYNEMVNIKPLPQPETYKKGINTYPMILILMLLGTLAVLISTYKFVSEKNDELTAIVQKYMQKSAVWADDYSRQFLDINVKYIVLGTLAFFSVFGLFLGAVAGGFLGFVIFAIFFGIGLYFGLKMPGIILDVLKKRRGEKINNQLMDALILLSNSLKSGMDIVQGFDMVSRDLRPPIADEFALVIKNYKLGTPFEKALEGMEERVESRLLSYMVKAIVLQRQVGGNLTKIFARIVENIREESKLEEKLQAMTAQQRIQALVVGIMPWVMVGVMFVFQPDTMVKFYTSSFGVAVLVMCIIWIGLGIKMVNKLGEIKV